MPASWLGILQWGGNPSALAPRTARLPGSELTGFVVKPPDLREGAGGDADAPLPELLDAGPGVAAVLGAVDVGSCSRFAARRRCCNGHAAGVRAARQVPSSDSRHGAREFEGERVESAPQPPTWCAKCRRMILVNQETKGLNTTLNNSLVNLGDQARRARRHASRQRWTPARTQVQALRGE